MIIGQRHFVRDAHETDGSQKPLVSAADPFRGVPRQTPIRSIGLLLVLWRMHRMSEGCTRPERDVQRFLKILKRSEGCSGDQKDAQEVRRMHRMWEGCTGGQNVIKKHHRSPSFVQDTLKSPPHSQSQKPDREKGNCRVDCLSKGQPLAGAPIISFVYAALLSSSQLYLPLGHLRKVSPFATISMWGHKCLKYLE